MAKKEVKTRVIQCWGNPTDTLEILRQISNTCAHDFLRHALSKLCCILTPMGFNCSMSFYHVVLHTYITTSCYITIGQNVFSYNGSQVVGDDINEFCNSLIKFINEHTAADGLFHFEYERRWEE